MPIPFRVRATGAAALVLVLLAGCGGERGDAPETGGAGLPANEAGDGGPLLDGAGDGVVPTVTDDSASTVAEAPPEPGPARLPAAVPVPGSGERPRFTRPEHMRGVYLNAWNAGSSRRVEAFLELARTTEINTFVMDIKDATGYVSYASGVPAVRESGALGELRIRDLPGLLRRLEAEGVYPVARIVIVKDPVLIAHRPELAVQDTAGGVWVDSKELIWLNLYNPEVWEYHIALAEEVARLGFPEIQWDYVRFPDAPAADMARAVFPGDTLGPRAEAVRAFLGYARERLDALGYDVSMTADVFGVTTTFRRDVGIGQLWERFIDRVDAALPMVYPSHYWTGSYGYREPNAHPYEVVKSALEDARRRSEAVEGAGRIIPWLQDFSLGPPRYGAAEVRAQIQGTYDAGIQEWILWNPGSRYTREALQPDTGFHLEPLIRVAGEVVPVSQRTAALDRYRRARFVADSLAEAARADSVAAARAEADTAGVARPDSAGVGGR